ncbi:MAG: AMP-binding protein, partial [Pseudomonadota bacterium]
RPYRFGHSPGRMQHHIDFSPHPQCPAPFNLADYVLHHGQAEAGKVALAEVGNATLTYGQLRHTVLSAAAHLQDQGVQSQDRVMLRLGNTSAFPIIFLALIAIDALPMPVSPMLTGTERDHLITLTDPARIITDDTIGGVLQPHPAPVKPILGDPNRAGYIMFTSGTGGAPKAVVHAHRAVWARRMMWTDWYDLQADDRLYHAGAFNWSFTLGTGLLDPWARGGTAIIAPGIPPSAHILRHHNVTICAAAPGVFRQLLAREGRIDAPTLRHGLTAGDRLPPTVRDGWQQATGTPLYEAFGMTECSTFLSDRPGQPPGLTPQNGRHVALTNDGRLGVHISDPGLMLGYWKGGQMTLPQRDNVFETNDMMQLTPPHTLQFLARDGGAVERWGLSYQPGRGRRPPYNPSLCGRNCRDRGPRQNRHLCYCRLLHCRSRYCD